jgi:hypothetical protein
LNRTELEGNALEVNTTVSWVFPSAQKFTAEAIEKSKATHNNTLCIFIMIDRRVPSNT